MNIALATIGAIVVTIVSAFLLIFCGFRAGINYATSKQLTSGDQFAAATDDGYRRGVKQGRAEACLEFMGEKAK